MENINIVHCEDCQHFQLYYGDKNTESACNIGVISNPCRSDFCSKAIKRNKWIIETTRFEPISPTSPPTKITFCKCPYCDNDIGYENKDKYKYCPFCGKRVFAE